MPPTFYLHDGYTDSSLKAGTTILPEPRVFLDAHAHSNKLTQVVKTVEADSWIEARYQIGNW